jgi:hypothetical protein
MSSEIRALPNRKTDRIQCSHCRRLFTPLLLARAPVPRFCSVQCAQPSPKAVRSA